MIDFANYIPKILVVGDLIIDSYLWGSSERISPEAPVQIVDVESENTLLGGAGNVINNLNSLGAYVDIISVIGECNTSKEIKALISNINISTKFLISQNDRFASKKTRIMAAKQQVVRYDHESANQINSDSETNIINTFSKIIKNYDLVIFSDYGKGIFSYDLTQSLIKIAKNHNKRVLIDPKGSDYSKYHGAFLLTPNKKEASEATNTIIKDDESLKVALKKLKKQCNLDVSIITLSHQGVAVYDSTLRIHPTAAREVFDVTGAGDTIIAALGFAMALNNNIDSAIKFANIAAGVVVGKIGSATVTLNEVSGYENSLNRVNVESKIKNFDMVRKIATELRDKNKKIIFTNGCFDILHVGHVKYLEEAKKLGDVLILGLNSDISVRRIKGKSRPINSQNDRAYLLASLESVDYVVIFNEDTPLDLITLIEPDILAKGSDYDGQEVVGQEIAKELRLIEFIDGISTSNIIERIQNL